MEGRKEARWEGPFLGRARTLSSLHGTGQLLVSHVTAACQTSFPFSLNPRQDHPCIGQAFHDHSRMTCCYVYRYPNHGETSQACPTKIAIDTTHVCRHLSPLSMLLLERSHALASLTRLFQTRCFVFQKSPYSTNQDLRIPKPYHTPACS